MAITTIFRRSVSSVLPLAVCTVQKNSRHRALFTALYQCSFSTLSHKPYLRPFASSTLLHFYSSSTEKERPIPSADDTLLRAIESKIRSNEESGNHDAKEEVADGFPFEIQGNPGGLTISLAREYKGEAIKVKVYTRHIIGEGDDKDNDDSSRIILLDVSVSKKNQNGTYLIFRCSGLPDEIIIHSLLVKNPETSEFEDIYKGPDFKKMDKNLRKAFHKYLEVRGIKPSMLNFLYKYMSSKISKEYDWG